MKVVVKNSKISDASSTDCGKNLADSYYRFIKSLFSPTDSLHIAIDRTKWSQFNFLIISIIWDKRAIPLYFELYRKKEIVIFSNKKPLSPKYYQSLETIE
jgi:hypothetical protein